ncbi:hypothetical protein EV182_003761 [Spiromyces aspiralis]|uniref:Uncharacterized protein n=1 Tax=Spiromyces aspiralis TaxID=68401 RepID=A0ACC1HTC2_9FUNG|nr:hypothetical protein EV182_003761 [Spiromyces aspiralis]
MKPTTYLASLDKILKMAGLKPAYNQFGGKFKATIDRIMAALANKEEYLLEGSRSSEAKGRLRPEELLEAQFAVLRNVMPKCLEAEVPLAQMPAIINEFQVSGNTHMPNSEGVLKKCVDIMLVCKGMDSTSWFDILLNIEVKSDADRILPLHRGQYVWYAAEEWPQQVRHYLLGGVLARTQLYVFYNDRNREIYEASIGKLLLADPNESGNNLRNAVTFILFLMTCTETELGFTFEDAARDLHTLHIAPAPGIVGHASWLFKGTREDGHGWPDIYVKFDARYSRRESEIRVMNWLRAHGIQHSAQLIKGFELKGHNKFHYELLALKDHGEPIDEYFVWLEERKMLNAGIVRAVIKQVLMALGQAEQAQRCSTAHHNMSASNITRNDKLDEQSDDPTTRARSYL